MEREQTTIRLPRELKEELQREADKRDESFNGLVVLMPGWPKHRYSNALNG